MRKALSILACCTLIILFGCTVPSGTEVTKHFDAPDWYSKLELHDGLEVTVTDEVTDIVITGDEKVLEKLRVQSSSSTLKIYRNDAALMYVTKTKVLLPYQKGLRDVRLNMDCDFHTNFGIDGNEVYVSVDSRSKFSGFIHAKKLEMKLDYKSEVNSNFEVDERMYLKMSGTSTAFLEGYVPTVELDMNDESSLETGWNTSFYTFYCDYCYGTMNGKCKAKIDCEESISVKLTNESFIYYTGDPDISGSTVDGTSDVLYDGYKK